MHNMTETFRLLCKYDLPIIHISKHVWYDVKLYSYTSLEYYITNDIGEDIWVDVSHFTSKENGRNIVIDGILN